MMRHSKSKYRALGDRVTLASKFSQETIV